MSTPTTDIRFWTRPSYLISTDPSLIPLETLNDALESPEVAWARRLPLEDLKLLISKSACFGLYLDPSTGPSRELIGFARVITDYVTLAYLTDVYVLPKYQNQSLGSWLIDCVKEWTDSMVGMRQLVLVSKEGRHEEYYARKLGTGRMEDAGIGYRIVNRRGPGSNLLDAKKGT